ncbi:hypothetical protein [Saccharopolyspora elongata]|uniref:hypothetical protein n=1 Tax=Saccharopolyspora elongata TaxID=2530387 RepID=UPI001053399B|nr:hypothetical protein [Saccharopolyspora elongata]
MSAEEFDLTTELHAAARRLAQAFLADAGEAATTWLRITPGVTETTYPVGSAHFRLGNDFHEAQSELVDLLRSEASPFVVELAVRESGSFDLTCTADLDSATRVVLVPGFLHRGWTPGPGRSSSTEGFSDFA